MDEGFDPTVADLAAGRYDEARHKLDPHIAKLQPVFAETMNALVASQLDAAEEKSVFQLAPTADRCRPHAAAASAAPY